MVMTDPQPLTISVEEAAKLAGIGRNLAYRLAAEGTLPGVIRIGHLYKVSRAGLLKALNAESN